MISAFWTHSFNVRHTVHVRLDPVGTRCQSSPAMLAMCLWIVKNNNNKNTYYSDLYAPLTGKHCNECGGKVPYFLHFPSLVCRAPHCRLWIWTPFLWLIPQDLQPFPAPRRKPHALCINIQAYFGAQKQKNMWWETRSFPGSATSPRVARVSVENEVSIGLYGITKRKTWNI